MTLALVFEHHSLPCESEEQARELVTQFVKLVFVCHKRFGYEILMIDEPVDKNWFTIELTSNYFWRDWFEWAKQQANLRDYVRAFRSLQTRQPMFLPEDLTEVEFLLEVGLNGITKGMRSLLAAYWYETFILSFPSREPWRQTQVPVWVNYLDNKGELIEESVLINNLSDEQSILQHTLLLQNKRDERLQAGKDMWDRRELFFPNLIFLENKFGNQLKSWSHRPDILKKARESLHALNDFVGFWRDGKYSGYRHDYLHDCGLRAEVSGESTSVANHERKRAEREFWIPTGVKIYAENHIKLPEGFRLYFYPSSEDKLVYVVYLGPHLSL